MSPSDYNVKSRISNSYNTRHTSIKSCEQNFYHNTFQRFSQTKILFVIEKVHFGNKNKQNHNFNSVSSLNNAGSNVHYCISNLADIKEMFLSCTVIFLSHNSRDGLFIFFIGVIDTHLSSFHDHNYRNGYCNYH